MLIEQDNGNSFHEWEMESTRKEERPKSKRREKASPWEVEMDLGGESSRRNMLKSNLDNTKESHLAVLEDSEKQEDVKLYGQLPDYGDFQGYDLGMEDILLQIALRIYDNFHRPSWQTLKHHLFAVRMPKTLFRKIKELAGNGKKR